jgi:hypothetical protein
MLKAVYKGCGNKEMKSDMAKMERSVACEEQIFIWLEIGAGNNKINPPIVDNEVESRCVWEC